MAIRVIAVEEHRLRVLLAQREAALGLVVAMLAAVVKRSGTMIAVALVLALHHVRGVIIQTRVIGAVRPVVVFIDAHWL